MIRSPSLFHISWTKCLQACTFSPLLMAIHDCLLSIKYLMIQLCQSWSSGSMKSLARTSGTEYCLLGMPPSLKGLLHYYWWKCLRPNILAGTAKDTCKSKCMTTWSSFSRRCDRMFPLTSCSLCKYLYSKDLRFLHHLNFQFLYQIWKTKRLVLHCMTLFIKGNLCILYTFCWCTRILGFLEPSKWRIQGRWLIVLSRPFIEDTSGLSNVGRSMRKSKWKGSLRC